MSTEQNKANQADLLAGVLDSSLDGIYAFQCERDGDGQIIDFIFVVVNRAAEKMIGRSADQLLGKRLLETLPGNKTDGLFDAYVQVVETKTPFVTEHYYEHDGLAKWFSISATPYGDGFTVSFADITGRKASEEHFRVLFEMSTDAHLLFDETGIIDCNQAAVDMLGYSHKQALLKVHPAKLSPEFQPDGRRSLEKCIEMDQAARDNGYHRFDWMHRRVDGSDIPVEVTLNPVDLSGKEALLVVWHDLTERVNQQRQLESQQRRLEFALQTSRTGLWDWDIRSGENYLSDTWYTMLGYEPGEMPMRVESWHEITLPEDLARAQNALAQYFAGETDRYTCEIRVKNKAGDWQWVLDVGEAIERDPSGNVIRMIGLHVDIHEQKSAQVELETARDQAQQASAAKSAFVANMSHEIRTPMNAILGYADLLLDTGQSAADKRNHAQTIRRNGKHLLDILNDILDLSKIEAGKIAIEQVSCAPSELFEDVINLMSPKADQRRIGLFFNARGKLPKSIKCDPTRLRQVLLNLLGNAIKFTDRGEVGLTVEFLSEKDGSTTLRCDVTDTGIGISDDQLDQLFKPFSQADQSTTRKFGGTGLGLAISTSLCKKLGGELSCTSSLGNGSTFTATFRVQVVKESATEAAPSAKTTCASITNALKNKRVLIVEDGPDNQRLFKHYVTKAGAQAELAENGAVGKDMALAAWQDGCPFDVVLMDMQMPVLDGYDATGQLRDAGYDLPILALTAHASVLDRNKCLAAGCTDYLSKPVDRQQLIQTIAGRLNANQQLGAGI